MNHAPDILLHVLFSENRMRALHINKIPIHTYTSYEELSCYRHHHQSLSCHKKHKAIIVSPQRRWFCATFRISFQVRYMAFRFLPCCLFPSGVQMDLCSRREGLSSQSSCREWDVTQWELNSGMGLTTSHCKVSVLFL